MIVFTIGYERADLDDIIRLLKENDVAILIDVRKNAKSVRPEFSKKRLRKCLEAVGIEYRHLSKLGTPKHLREYLRETNDWKTFASRMTDELMKHISLIDEIFDEFKGKNICLFCRERNPEMCHRSIVADIFVHEFGCEGFHLYVVEKPAYPANWDEIVETARKQAGNRCQRCGEEGCHLDVHHIDGNIENKTPQT